LSDQRGLGQWGPESAETVAGQDLATRIEAKIKNDKK
jgi:hypothetical protein